MAVVFFMQKMLRYVSKETKIKICLVLLNRFDSDFMGKKDGEKDVSKEKEEKKRKEVFVVIR